MSAPEVLKDCRRLGVELTADRGNLICKASKGALTLQLSEAIRDHKYELLSLLTDDTTPQELIRILSRLGMRLTSDSGHLVCHGARGKMTDELRQVIQAHKAALLKSVISRASRTMF
ncbi:MAG: hypothetical protein M3120_10205 [Pseudomonadota bacterium]|nr:hypothetical protein [Pseudomonadota bacterium]